MNLPGGRHVDPVTPGCIAQGPHRPAWTLAGRDGAPWRTGGRGGVLRVDRDGVRTLVLQAAASTVGNAPDPATGAPRGAGAPGLLRDADPGALVRAAF